MAGIIGVGTLARDFVRQVLGMESNQNFKEKMVVFLFYFAGQIQKVAFISFFAGQDWNETDEQWMIGDITTVSIPGRWKPDTPLMLPKAGVFAHAQALVVAHRIAAEISGQTPQDKFCGDGYCMLESGEDLAGFAYGDFFAEPAPQVHLHKIGKAWHLGKVLFEKWWLSPPGLKREALRLALQWGARMKGIRISL